MFILLDITERNVFILHRLIYTNICQLSKPSVTQGITAWLQNLTRFANKSKEFWTLNTHFQRYLYHADACAVVGAVDVAPGPQTPLTQRAAMRRITPVINRFVNYSHFYLNLNCLTTKNNIQICGNKIFKQVLNKLLCIKRGSLFQSPNNYKY